MSKIIQEVDLLEVINFINKKVKISQRVFLNRMEEVITDRQQYTEMRKLFLDFSNNLARSVLNAILGKGFEGYIK